MKTNDYVKFMTQEFVKYMDQSKVSRELEKEQRKIQKEPFLSRWFGVLPLSMSLLIAKKSEEEKQSQPDQEKTS